MLGLLELWVDYQSCRNSSFKNLLPCINSCFPIIKTPMSLFYLLHFLYFSANLLLLGYYDLCTIAYIVSSEITERNVSLSDFIQNIISWSLLPSSLGNDHFRAYLVEAFPQVCSLQVHACLLSAAGHRPRAQSCRLRALQQRVLALCCRKKEKVARFNGNIPIQARLYSLTRICCSASHKTGLWIQY